MNESWLPNVLGTVAGLLSTSSFVPQVLKAWREGDTKAISKRTYIINTTSFVLWTIFGFLIWSFPVIVFNALSLALTTTILVLKIRNDGARSP
jgi:MtN3 and saliva related transmembrane protein